LAWDFQTKERKKEKELLVEYTLCCLRSKILYFIPRHHSDALEPHEDAPRQAPQQAALLLPQALRRQVPPLVEDQVVAQAH